jgi:hypothetical protein
VRTTVDSSDDHNPSSVGGLSGGYGAPNGQNGQRDRRNDQLWSDLTREPGPRDSGPRGPSTMSGQTGRPAGSSGWPASCDLWEGSPPAPSSGPRSTSTPRRPTPVWRSTPRPGSAVWGTDVRNVRSQRVIARLGARHEGTLRRYQRRADGKVRDPWLFSVTAEDWPAVRRLLWTRGHPLTLRPVAPTLVA